MGGSTSSESVACIPSKLPDVCEPLHPAKVKLQQRGVTIKGPAMVVQRNPVKKFLKIPRKSYF
jgi:hypothetical protein